VTPTNTNRPNIGVRFGLVWTLASTGGMLIAFVAGFFVIGAAVEALTGMKADDVLAGDGPIPFLALTVLFAIAGLGIGLAQWLVLRRHVPRADLWVIGTGLGFAVVAALFGLLTDVVSELVNEVVHNLVGGAVAGVVQWSILRRHVRRSGWWVGASALGFLVAGAISDSLGGGPLGMLAGIAAMAAITGVVLLRLLRGSAPSVSAA